MPFLPIPTQVRSRQTRATSARPGTISAYPGMMYPGYAYYAAPETDTAALLGRDYGGYYRPSQVPRKIVPQGQMAETYGGLTPVNAPEYGFMAPPEGQQAIPTKGLPVIGDIVTGAENVNKGIADIKGGEYGQGVKGIVKGGVQTGRGLLGVMNPVQQMTQALQIGVTDTLKGLSQMASQPQKKIFMEEVYPPFTPTGPAMTGFETGELAAEAAALGIPTAPGMALGESMVSEAISGGFPSVPPVSGLAGVDIGGHGFSPSGTLSATGGAPPGGVGGTSGGGPSSPGSAAGVAGIGPGV